MKRRIKEEHKNFSSKMSDRNSNLQNLSQRSENAKVLINIYGSGEFDNSFGKHLKKKNLQNYSSQSFHDRSLIS